MKMQRSLVYIFLAILFVVALLSVWTVASSVTLRKQFRPDTYRESIVHPDKEAYCPGETMTYTYQITMKDALGPTTIWDAWCHPNGLCDTQLTTQRYSIRSQPVQQHMKASVIVPKLSAGQWKLVHATTFHSDGYDMFAVPFVVPQFCGVKAPSQQPNP